MGAGSGLSILWRTGRVLSARSRVNAQLYLDERLQSAGQLMPPETLSPNVGVAGSGIGARARSPIRWRCPAAFAEHIIRQPEAVPLHAPALLEDAPRSSTMVG